MQQIKDKYDGIERNKLQQKHIQEEELKLKEKLKLMEEYREKQLKEKAQKVIRKQNNINKILKKLKLGNKTKSKSLIEPNIPNNSSKHYCKTVESGNKKLPSISITDRYGEIQEKKDKIEKKFI